MFRRESIRPELNPRYQPLCRPEVKVTQQLFGEDLGKVVKDMSEQQNAVSVTIMGSLKVKEQRYAPHAGNLIRPAYPGRGREKSKLSFGALCFRQYAEQRAWILSVGQRKRMVQS